MKFSISVLAIGVALIILPYVAVPVELAVYSPDVDPTEIPEFGTVQLSDGRYCVKVSHSIPEYENPEGKLRIRDSTGEYTVSPYRIDSTAPFPTEGDMTGKTDVDGDGKLTYHIYFLVFCDRQGEAFRWEAYYGDSYATTSSWHKYIAGIGYVRNTQNDDTYPTKPTWPVDERSDEPAETEEDASDWEEVADHKINAEIPEYENVVVNTQSDGLSGVDPNSELKFVLTALGVGLIGLSVLFLIVFRGKV